MLRARQVQQKRERRQEILTAAGRLLERVPFPDITMAQVASETGLAKGTLYLYFETKESLFLDLLREEFRDWFDSLAVGLLTLSRRDSSLEAAQLIAEETASRPRFRALIVLLHGVLENNLSEETALAFKRELLMRSASLGALLEDRLGTLAKGQGLQLLMQLYAAAIGLQFMAEPAPAIRSLMRHPDLAPFHLDFGEEFRLTAERLFAGARLERRNHREKRH